MGWARIKYTFWSISVFIIPIAYILYRDSSVKWIEIYYSTTVFELIHWNMAAQSMKSAQFENKNLYMVHGVARYSCFKSFNKTTVTYSLRL